MIMSRTRPTPRWTTYHAAFFGIELPDTVPATIQDRAYTSTYTWIDSEGAVDDITSSRIRQSVDAAMAARGFSKDTSNPDLAISYQVPTTERTSFSTINSGWGGGGWGMGGWGMGMGTSTTTQQNWTEGSLILAVFDGSSKNMVWTGTATTDLDQNRTPQERQELVDEAVGKLLEDFPPGS